MPSLAGATRHCPLGCSGPGRSRGFRRCEETRLQGCSSDTAQTARTFHELAACLPRPPRAEKRSNRHREITAMRLRHAVVAEFVGSALLLATVVGSGIMGERLAGGNVAIALLANTLATGAMLVALILTFGPISGAHFNPAVTLADASQGGLAWREVPAYLAAQVLGAI